MLNRVRFVTTKKICLDDLKAEMVPLYLLMKQEMPPVVGFHGLVQEESLLH